ncbi:hypothetical protein STSO111631_03535 [Stackebrandtia soli]
MLDGCQLNAYLERIYRDGMCSVSDVVPSVGWLARLHGAHVRSVPYETVDMQLGRGVSLDSAALWAKVVASRRGGFCFELNGSFALLLRGLGFDVTVVEAAVNRAEVGDSAWGNHMALVARVDGVPYLVDVGLGNAFVEPLPLREGVVLQAGRAHHLEDVGGRVWRCRPDPAGTVRSFDVRPVPRRVVDFVARCEELSTSPESPFVGLMSVQSSDGGRHARLRARTLTVVGASGWESTRLIEDAAELANVLHGVFGLGAPSISGSDVKVLWERACAQHAAWCAGSGFVDHLDGATGADGRGDGSDEDSGEEAPDRRDDGDGRDVSEVDTGTGRLDE